MDVSKYCKTRGFVKACFSLPPHESHVSTAPHPDESAVSKDQGCHCTGELILIGNFSGLRTAAVHVCPEVLACHIQL